MKQFICAMIATVTLAETAYDTYYSKDYSYSPENYQNYAAYNKDYAYSYSQDAYNKNYAYAYNKDYAYSNDYAYNYS